MTNKEQVHRVILREFPLRGRAPTMVELPGVLKPMSAADIHLALVELEQEDAIFMDQKDNRIVAAYPYSLSRTRHRVMFADGVKVWAMCALDALGIHFMTEQNITIDSISLQTRVPICIRLAGGKVSHVAPPDVAVWLAAKRKGEKHDAITSCPGTNFYVPGELPVECKEEEAEKSGMSLSLSDAIKRSERLFGSLLD